MKKVLTNKKWSAIIKTTKRDTEISEKEVHSKVQVSKSPGNSESSKSNLKSLIPNKTKRTDGIWKKKKRWRRINKIDTDNQGFYQRANESFAKKN